MILQWRADQSITELLIDKLQTNHDNLRCSSATNVLSFEYQSLFLCLNHSLIAQGSYLPFFTQLRGFNCASSRILFTAKTHLDGTSPEQTIICGQLFAGHVEGSRPMTRKKTKYIEL